MSAQPQEQSASYGVIRSDLMDALLLGRQEPHGVSESLREWANGVIQSAHGPLLGLSTAGIPEEMYESLRWAGMPMSTDGDISWDTEVKPEKIEKPSIENNKLLIPGADILKEITSVAMRPLRRFVADRYQIRLQAATGISCYLWRNQALFISCLDVRVSGFVHGPEYGQRSSLAIAPGDAQLSSWLDEE